MWRLRAFSGLSNGPKPLLTIVSYFGEKHFKIIDANGQSVKKTFNGDGSAVAKPLKTIDSNGTLRKIHYHPIVMKI